MFTNTARVEPSENDGDFTANATINSRSVTGADMPLKDEDGENMKGFVVNGAPDSNGPDESQHAKPKAARRRSSVARRASQHLSHRAEQMRQDINTGTHVQDFRNATGFHRKQSVRIFLSEPPETDSKMELFRWNVASFMESAPVKGFVVMLIFANAVVIGVEADYGDGSDIWHSMEMAFLAAFTIELALNMIGLGHHFWADAWNYLDFFVVIFSLVDFGMTISMDGNSSTGLSVVRLVRIVRVLRVVTFLEKLVYLCSAFAKGMASAFWVLLLMTLALYIFACLGRSFFGNSALLKIEAKEKYDIDVEELFGSIPATMLTLVQFFTYDDAMGVQRAVANTYPAAWLYFISFLVLIAMGMLELMTSIFIDSLLEEKKTLEKNKASEKNQQRKEVNNLITGLFETFDVQGKGHLSQEDLDAIILFVDDPATDQLLECVEIDKWLLKEAIRLSDLDGNGTVSRTEFEQSLDSIQASVTKADMRELTQRISRVESNTVDAIEDANQALDEKMQIMDQRLQRIEQLLMTQASGAVPRALPGQGPDCPTPEISPPAKPSADASPPSALAPIAGAPSPLPSMPRDPSSGDLSNASRGGLRPVQSSVGSSVLPPIRLPGVNSAQASLST